MIVLTVVVTIEWASLCNANRGGGTNPQCNFDLPHRPLLTHTHTHTRTHIR